MPHIVKTATTNLVYCAPPGNQNVSDMPCERRALAGGGTGIFSTWSFTTAERAAIAAGANLEVGIWYVEPVPPLSVAIVEPQFRVHPLPAAQLVHVADPSKVATEDERLAPPECVYRYCPHNDVCATKGKCACPLKEGD